MVNVERCSVTAVSPNTGGPAMIVLTVEGIFPPLMMGGVSNSHTLLF